jgi:hypothetical protein
MAVRLKRLWHQMFRGFVQQTEKIRKLFYVLKNQRSLKE